MVSMMREVVDRGTATSVRAWGVRFPVGAKTGTTNDFKDAWFVGYSSAVVVGVWVGFDQPATIGRDAFGSRVALPIWAAFMRRTARILRPPSSCCPPASREEELCRVSHLRPVEDCPTYVEYFKEGDDVGAGALLPAATRGRCGSASGAGDRRLLRSRPRLLPAEMTSVRPGPGQQAHPASPWSPPASRRWSPSCC